MSTINLNQYRHEETTLALEEIKPYKNNPRKNDDAVEPLAQSMKLSGYDQYILVDENNEILKGHTRLKALSYLNSQHELGQGKLAEVRPEAIKVIKVYGLTEKEKRAARIYDNKVAEIAQWDTDLLKIETEELGIDLDEITGGASFDVAADSFEVTEDNYKEDTTAPDRAKEGDLWRLGRHYLIVGDSTKDATLERLLKASGADYIDMLLTDPPYNVDYEAKEASLINIRPNQRVAEGIATEIDNDSMTMEEFIDFLTQTFAVANDHLKEGGSFYIWHATWRTWEAWEACRRVGWKIRQGLVWAKNHFTFGRQDYQWKHEPCLYGWKEGAAHYFINNRALTTVIQEEAADLDNMKKEDMKALLEKILNATPEQLPVDLIEEDKPMRNADHPTMKPVRLLAHLIHNSSRREETIFDPFGGSGSTLIACEQLDRRCLMAELSPHYATVIIDRWETFTGKKAEQIKEDRI